MNLHVKPKIEAMESRKGVSGKSALTSPIKLYFAAWLVINYYTTFTLPQFIKPFLDIEVGEGVQLVPEN